MATAASLNPFVIHRHHLDLYSLARKHGLDDHAYRQLVEEADERLITTADVGFSTTPLVDLRIDPGSGPDQELTVDTGTVVAKVETGSVGGSHKARHLFGLLLELLITERGTDAGAQPLAIASCGNAALGAALVARSAGRRLQVFVPDDADPIVLAALDGLAAETTVCPRRPGGSGGDPCVEALDNAIASGAVAFTVQGSRVPSVIDGARTLGLELAAQLAERDLEPARLFVQVGGGALATAVMDGLVRARPGRPRPRLHPVQPATAHPYIACWRRAAPALLANREIPDPGTDAKRAALLAPAYRPDELAAFLDGAPELMRPWPETPHSIASGILDDITYDWTTVMAHQVLSAGWPVTVAEETFVSAARLAATQVQPPPDETGAAGLAGLLTLADATGGLPTAPGTANVVLLTGVRRSA